MSKVRTKVLAYASGLAILCVAYCVFFDASALTGDSRQYATLGYNLAHHDSFSLGTSPDALAPTDYREPGYPALLAASIRFVSSLKRASLSDLIDGGRGTLLLRYAQIPVLLSTAMLASLLAGILTRRRLAEAGVFLLVGLSPSLVFSAQRLNTEHFAALLLLFFSWSMLRLTMQPNGMRALVAGLAAGMLVLTKAVFLYLVPLIAVAFAVLPRKDASLSRWRTVAVALLLVATTSAIAGGWMARNERQLGEFRLAGRGGVILLIRAEKNLMELKEYLGSFLYWTPYAPVRRGLVQAIFGEEALVEGGALGRLNRENDSSYYRTARKVRTDLVASEGTESKSVDDEIKRRAMALIMAHPLRHVALTLPVAWRGIFVEGSELLGPAGLLTALLSIGYGLALIWCGVLSIRERCWPLLMFLMPAGVLFTMHSVFTYNLSRFNVPAVPVFAVALAVMFDRICRRRQEKGIALCNAVPSTGEPCCTS